MSVVELVYDEGCPNVSEARAQLIHAFARTKMQPRWREWRIDDPEMPAHAQGYGSPTILVDGHDAGGAEPIVGLVSCRLYPRSDGKLRGVPEVDQIAVALGGSSANLAPGSRGGWKTSLTMLPAIGVALLPKVACPACWPAYAGFLSAIGLGFLIDTAYLLPLTAGFLVLAVGALAFRARHRRGYGPFAAGAIATGIVLIGKFAHESDPAMYGGLALLIGASIWNTWPRNVAQTKSCQACIGNEQQATIPPVR